MAKILVTQLKSQIGCTEPQRAALRSLGLHRIRHQVTHEDRPEIRGIINKISHLVSVEDVK